jgi:hypothetical protein
MMRSTLQGTGEKVVDTDDIGPALEQAFAQMRAEKSGTAGHNHAGFKMHGRQPPRDQSPLRPTVLAYREPVSHPVMRDQVVGLLRLSALVN